MQTGGTQKKTSASTPAMNPFAKAMAETESRANKNKSSRDDEGLFSEALAKTGSRLGGSDFSQEELQYQQEQFRKQQEKELLRKKLHDQINPVNQQDVFNARKENELKEIEGLKQELKMLVHDVKKLDQEVEKTLMTQVVDPGERAAYYKNFFSQVRKWVLQLREFLKDWANQSWAGQAKSKQKKMAKRQGPGMGTKAVHDTLHHERSNAYSGA